jgi:dCMP deaminase
MNITTNRPNWDIYYLTLAFLISQRSFDPSSKCGTVIVSKDNRVLSTGYNGPIKGSNDNFIPLTRPEKYAHMIHGEENALLAYSGSHQDIQEATAYITGRPCHKCLRMMIQKGITKIIHSKNCTKVVDKADKEAQDIMLRDHPTIDIREIPSDNIIQLLEKTIEYINIKNTQTPNY